MSATESQPIGMFDSGFGGLTVARAVIDLLPNEDLVYIGDTGRYPYGPRPMDEVREFAREIAWSLVRDHNAKVIVVACNTAAAAAFEQLRAELPVHKNRTLRTSAGKELVIRRSRSPWPLPLSRRRAWHRPEHNTPPASRSRPLRRVRRRRRSSPRPW